MAEAPKKNMPYGELFEFNPELSLNRVSYAVRLGNSGLKVSKIILGTMQYGSSGWQEWVLGEEEATEHIKYAYVHPVNDWRSDLMFSSVMTQESRRSILLT